MAFFRLISPLPVAVEVRGRTFDVAVRETGGSSTWRLVAEERGVPGSWVLAEQSSVERLQAITGGRGIDDHDAPVLRAVLQALVQCGSAAAVNGTG